MTDSTNTGEKHASLSDEASLITNRREKLSKLRDEKAAYRNHFRWDHLATCVIATYEQKQADELEQMAHKVKLAGRIMTRRKMGKASFVHIQDMSGKIQVYVRKDALAEGEYDSFNEWDLGDIIGVAGTVF